MKRLFNIRVTVYHSFDVEADSYEEARDKAEDVMWDDHVKDVIIDVEERD